MTAPYKKYLQKCLRTSSVLLLFLNACGQQGGQPMTQAHISDTGVKSNAQKLRQACMQQAQDGTIVNAGAVSICTFYPGSDAKDKNGKLGNQYKISTHDRKLKLSHTTANNTINETISINAGMSFYGEKTMPTPEEKKSILAVVESDCMPNMKYFWSRSNITLDLNFTIDANLSNADQVLSLHYAPPVYSTFMGPPDLSASGTAQVALATGSSAPVLNDFELQIEEWGNGVNKLSTRTACSADVEEAMKSKLDSEKALLRSACRKQANQNFCLALNKMVGHWMGAVDRTDLNCFVPKIQPVATPTDAIVQTPAPVVDTTSAAASDPNAASADDTVASPVAPAANSVATPSLIEKNKLIYTSFMIFLVNPVPSTPLVTTDPVLNQTSNKTVSTTAVTTAPSGDDLIIANAAAQMDADIAKKMPTQPGQPETTPIAAPTVQSQLTDPSFASWLTYHLSKDDVRDIFGCDYAVAEKVVAANHPAALAALKPVINSQKSQAATTKMKQ